MKWEFDHDEEHLILDATKNYVNMLLASINNPMLSSKAMVILKGKKISHKEVLQQGIDLGLSIIKKMNDKVIAECKDHY